MLDLTTTSAVWAIGSAVGVAVIGAASLAGGAARPRGAFAFGLFVIVWGAQITLGNLVDLVADRAWATSLFLLYLTTAFPLGYLLVEFSAAVSSRPQWIGWKASRVVAATFSFAAAALLVVEPAMFFGGLVETATGIEVVRGPLFAPLLLVPAFAGFGVATVTLARAWRRAASPRIATRIATLLTGLGIYVGYTAAYYLVRYLGIGYLFPDSPVLTYVPIFAALSLVVLGVIASALGAARAARSPRERRHAQLVALALAVPFAWGGAEAFLSLTTLPPTLFVGLWRLAGIGVIAYGLARWRLPDLPKRASDAAAAGAGASAAAATGVATYGLLVLLAATPTFAAGAGALVAAGALMPGLRVARRIFHRATAAARLDDDDSIYGARVDAYRAALEASLARDSLDEDADFLAALRERFGITESEDRLLHHYARACIIAPREGDAHAAYDRLRLLGEGGAGRTWLARDRVRDRLVVLKEPLERWQREPGLRELVLREARLAARVRHANVVRIEEVIENKSSPILVMEYAEGGSLSDLLRRRGVLPWREALTLLVPILRGVEAIHQAGIVHRDLKPSNVVLTLEGEPKIADFGIAVSARGDGAHDRTVVAGTTLVGTYAYLAPEVRAGEPGDRASDVYACAAMLHEMLYGSPPGLAAPVLAKNEVPAALARSLARALAANPAQRPASARALAEELTTLTGIAKVA